MLMDILGAAGHLADTPGAHFRGLLAGKPGVRTSGEQLMEAWGWLDSDDPQGSVKRSFLSAGADVLADPLNLIGGLATGLAFKAARTSMKGAGVASAAMQAGKAAGTASKTGLASAFTPDASTLLSFAPPIGGLGILNMNQATDPLTGESSQQSPWLTALGGSLIAAPMVMVAGRGLSRLGKGKASAAKVVGEGTEQVAAARP